MGAKTPKVKYVVLPVKLMKKLEEIKYTEGQRFKAIKLLALVLVQFLKDDLNFDEYRDFPVSYWKKAICPHYEKIVKPLVVLDVLERNNQYFAGKCKSYRINPELLKGELKVYEYKDKKERQHDSSYVCKRTRAILKSCQLDKVRAFNSILNYVDEGAIEQTLKFNREIKVEGSILVKYEKGKKPTQTSLDHALRYAFQNKMDLIQDGRKFIVADKKEFIERKKDRIYYHYTLQCLMINRQDIYANRNQTNFRLDSNLTVFPSLMIPYISLDDELLVSIDLVNSQFVFLAALIQQGYFDCYLRDIRKSSSKLILTHKKSSRELAFTSSISLVNNIVGGDATGMVFSNVIDINKKGSKERLSYMCANLEKEAGFGYKNELLITDDIKQFIELAQGGGLYEYIRDSINIGTGEAGRKKAKQMMFEILFSKHNNYTAGRKKLKQIFPTLIQMIDAYKKDQKHKRKKAREKRGKKDDGLGDNQFAILLQKKESEVFIDNLLSKLHKLNLKVLSKHDSILCKKSDLIAVKGIMKGVLNKEFGEGKYQLKIE